MKATNHPMIMLYVPSRQASEPVGIRIKTRNSQVTHFNTTFDQVIVGKIN